jgi:hypothetical protein
MPTYNPTGGLLQKIGFMAKVAFTAQGPIATPMEANAGRGVHGATRSVGTRPRGGPAVQLLVQAAAILVATAVRALPTTVRTLRLRAKKCFQSSLFTSVVHIESGRSMIEGFPELKSGAAQTLRSLQCA